MSVIEFTPREDRDPDRREEAARKRTPTTLVALRRHFGYTNVALGKIVGGCAG